MCIFHITPRLPNQKWFHSTHAIQIASMIHLMEEFLASKKPPISAGIDRFGYRHPTSSSSRAASKVPCRNSFFVDSHMDQILIMIICVKYNVVKICVVSDYLFKIFFKHHVESRMKKIVRKWVLICNDIIWALRKRDEFASWVLSGKEALRKSSFAGWWICNCHNFANSWIIKYVNNSSKYLKVRSWITAICWLITSPWFKCHKVPNRNSTKWVFPKIMVPQNHPF